MERGEGTRASFRRSSSLTLDRDTPNPRLSRCTVLKHVCPPRGKTLHLTQWDISRFSVASPTVCVFAKSGHLVIAACLPSSSMLAVTECALVEGSTILSARIHQTVKFEHWYPQ